MVQNTHAENHVVTSKIGTPLEEVMSFEHHVSNASFRCRGTRDGEDYVGEINPQKTGLGKKTGGSHQAMSGACSNIEYLFPAKVI
jgi:hypothetical protein